MFKFKIFIKRSTDCQTGEWFTSQDFSNCRIFFMADAKNSSHLLETIFFPFKNSEYLACFMVQTALWYDSLLNFYEYLKPEFTHGSL